MRDHQSVVKNNNTSQVLSVMDDLLQGNHLCTKVSLIKRFHCIRISQQKFQVVLTLVLSPQFHNIIIVMYTPYHNILYLPVITVPPTHQICVQYFLTDLSVYFDPISVSK